MRLNGKWSDWLAGAVAAFASCLAVPATVGATGEIPKKTEASLGADAYVYPVEGPVAEFHEKGFRYRKLLESSDGGRFMRVPYDEYRDVNDRDEIPVRKVKSWFVRKLPKGAETEASYTVGGRVNFYRAVGALAGDSKFTVIYVHGRGGTRDWGFDDERFGGNFNRLKNLALKSGGAYVSPDFTDFETDGFAEIKALVAKFRPLTSGKLVVACGSLGNTHCWNIASDPNVSRQVDGLIVLAGFPDERFFSSGVAKAAARHIPLIIGHGSSDPDYSYEPTLAFFKKLRASVPGYPVRYLLFNTGRHGAPVRMIDWRDSLNWIAAN